MGTTVIDADMRRVCHGTIFCPIAEEITHLERGPAGSFRIISGRGVARVWASAGLGHRHGGA